MGVKKVRERSYYCNGMGSQYAMCVMSGLRDHYKYHGCYLSPSCNLYIHRVIVFGLYGLIRPRWYGIAAKALCWHLVPDCNEGQHSGSALVDRHDRCRRP